MSADAGAPTPAPRAPLYRRPESIALVFVGGAVGTLIRFGAEQAIPSAVGEPVWSTVTVNLIGAFILGLLLEGLTRSGPDEGRRQRIRLLVGTGACGGLTTYSSFALDTRDLLGGGFTVAAAVYVLVTVIGGLVAAIIGIGLAGKVVRR